jgi:hypothetical protein
MFSFLRSLLRQNRHENRIVQFRPQFEALDERIVPSAGNLVLYNANMITSYANVGFINNPVGSLAAYNSTGQLDTDANHFTAQINWGDNTGWQPGQVALNNSPGERIPFVIKGTHDYTTAKDYTIEVMVTGDGATLTQQNCSASVIGLPAPASLPATQPGSVGGPKPLGSTQLVIYQVDALTATAGKAMPLSTVAQADGYYNGTEDKQAGDYQVQINWGDSPNWDAGFVNPNNAPASLPLLLQGSHTYTAPGTYIVVVEFTGPDGQTLSKQTTTVQVSPLVLSSGITIEQPATPPAPAVPVTLKGGVSTSTSPAPLTAVLPYASPYSTGTSLTNPSGTSWSVPSAVQFRIGVSTTNGFSLNNLANAIARASGDYSFNWQQWINDDFGPLVNGAFQNAASNMHVGSGTLTAYGTITASSSGKITVTASNASGQTAAIDQQWVNLLNAQLKAIGLQ